MTASNPTYIACDGEAYDYEPGYYVSTLDWFHLATLARTRMTDNCGDIHRWRGERRSFYTFLQKMKADEVVLMDA